MNIKLALLENDKQYGQKFINAFGEFYPQIEIYAFSDVDKAASSIAMRPVDVLLVSEEIYDADKDSLEKMRCKAIIVTVGTKGISQLDGHTALCKYQRIDHLNQAIMKIYSEVSNIVISDTASSGATSVFTFISGAGGNGCSTAAAAYSAYLAGKKQKVLYLDLNTFGIPDLFFSDSGNYTMTDCIIAVIEQKNNLSLQLKNFVRHDQSGVYYYSACVNALDRFDLTTENLQSMISCIVDSGEYDYIVIDAAPDWNEVTAYLSECSRSIFVVTDGSTFSNRKAMRVWETAETFFKSQRKDTAKLYLLYSCFASNAKKINDERVREFVTLPFSHDHHSASELVKQLSARQYWE